MTGHDIKLKALYDLRISDLERWETKPEISVVAAL